MSQFTLPLADACQVVVSISPVAAAAPTFNQGLITGTSTIIPSYSGSNPRIRSYTSLAGMSADGFTSANPEFLAAQLYFGQNPAPQILQVGRRDLTAIGTIAPSTGSAGTLYVVGDIITVTQGGATFGQATVSTVSAGGVVTGLTLVPGTQGTGYSTATGLTTTGGTGTGLLVDISAVGESVLQALQACRSASASWWGCMSTSAVAADHIAVAGWIQAITPASAYFYATPDAAVLNNTAGNVMATLKASLYNRAFGLYCTTQSGAFPNNAYAAAAVMGCAMGLNTGLDNSYFTLKFKPLIGVTTEPLTQSQLNTIESLNGNAYVNFANTYNWLEPGVMPNGQFFDEILALDMLSSDIQYSVVALLVSLPSIPLTNSGESQVLSAVDAACVRSVNRGFISPGTWTGVTILNLTAGTAMPKGYLCQADSFLKQSAGDRSARKGMPVYVSILESGALHSITIGLYVQR